MVDFLRDLANLTPIGQRLNRIDESEFQRLMQIAKDDSGTIPYEKRVAAAEQAMMSLPGGADLMAAGGRPQQQQVPEGMGPLSAIQGPGGDVSIRYQAMPDTKTAKETMSALGSVIGLQGKLSKDKEGAGSERLKGALDFIANQYTDQLYEQYGIPEGQTKEKEKGVFSKFWNFAKPSAVNARTEQMIRGLPGVSPQPAAMPSTQLPATQPPEPVTQTQPTQTEEEEKITVVNPKTGKRSRIPKSYLEEALKKGFRRVR